MSDVSELFWNASVEEIKSGYVHDSTAGTYTCLVCGEVFEQGVIYPADDVLYEASRYVKVHIEAEHRSMFSYLLGLEKKWTGLTDLQKTLLGYIHDGYSDQEIVKEMDGGSTSTIRNHRFTMREKEKQAKVLLAILELAGSKAGKKERFVPIHRTATMVDARYAITEAENEGILKTYFPEGPDGPISTFPKKEKRKLAILRHLTQRFEAGRKYSEKEVNAVLEAAFHDYVTLRRYLIEYGFLDRQADGSAYWVKR